MIDRREVAGWLEIARSFVGVACLLTALLGFAAAVLSGVHVATLLLVPIAMIVAALSSPMTLMLLVVAVLALHGLVLASATVIAALRRPAAAPTLEDLDPSDAAEARLRRRYEAGTIGAAKFRNGMLPLLKERYARGDLSLGEYEGAVDRLMRTGEAPPG
jgi:uncharacterized membrane protein